MAIHPGLFVDDNTGNGVTDPQSARLALAALLTGPGVLSGMTVTGSSSGAPNIVYSVAAGAVATARGAAATDGLYVWATDGATSTPAAAPAPASGTRWDLIWCRHKNAYTSDGFGDANSLPEFGVTSGAAGSSPNKPYSGLPAGVLVLAEAQVPTSALDATTALITQVAPPAAAAGAILAVSGSSAYPSSPRTGQAIYDLTLKQVLVWNGTGWTGPGRQQRWKVARTGTTNPLPLNAMTNIMQVNLPATAPAGNYLIVANTLLGCSATATGNLRVIDPSGANLSQDVPGTINAGSQAKLQWSDTITWAGGAGSVQVFVQVSGASGNAIVYNPQCGLSVVFLGP